MNNSCFIRRIMGRVLLIVLICFIGVSSSLAQETIEEKIDYARALFAGYMSSSKDEQNSKIIAFYEKCSEEQKEAILSFMLQAITDSLKADNKQFAMNYIDHYRLIVNPDDKYLGSLVLTEGKYYYEKMDAIKLSELKNYLNNISANSTLDYSSEISELNRMKEEVISSEEDMMGCWLMYNSNEKYGYPQEIINIKKTWLNQYVVTFEDPQLSKMSSGGSVGALIMKALGVPTGGVSDTCYFTRPKELFYFYSSEKLRKTNEGLASGLRGVVRTAGNSVIGDLARSENFSTQLFGWFGVIGAEGIFNSIIDEIAVSRKSFCLREGYVNYVNRSQMDIRYTYFIYKVTSKNMELSRPQITNVNSVLYKYPENCDIAFIDEMKCLITNHPLEQMEEKQYYKSHPEAKKARGSRKKRLLYNKLQWEKLIEYNQTH